jgi:hypothetical protein
MKGIKLLVFSANATNDIKFTHFRMALSLSFDLILAGTNGVRGRC